METYWERIRREREKKEIKKQQEEKDNGNK